MKRMIVALLFAASLPGQVVPVPDAKFPAFRTLMNANFIWLDANKEPSLGNPSVSDYCLVSTSGGVRSWSPCYAFTNYSTISSLTGYPSTFPPTTTGLALLGSANTFTTGLQDFSATTWKVPSGAGFTTSASSMFGYDTTAGFMHVWHGAADHALGTAAFSATSAFQAPITNYSTISSLTGYPSTFPPTTTGLALLGSAESFTAKQSFTGGADASGSTHTLPAAVVANVGALPSTGCVAGELAVVTGATAGQQIYENSTTGSCTWTQQVNSGGGTSTGFTSLVTPSTSMTLTCPQNSGGIFLGNAALSGNVTVTAVSGCPGSTSVSAQLSFAFQQPSPIGGGPYTVTLPSPFNQCDFSMVTAGVTLTETGTYNGTDYFGVTCSPSGGPSLDAGPVPTITGCGTVGSQIGNSLVGTFTSGQTTCAPVLTGLPTAPHGYNCTITERATGAQHGNVSSTATAPTFPAITTTSGDVMAFSCRAY